MAGQNHHFARYAPEKLPYAIDALRERDQPALRGAQPALADRAFIAGDYSIADMACYPWIVPHEPRARSSTTSPHLKRWFEAIAARPATVRAYARGAQVSTQTTLTEEAKKILFGQSAR